MRWELGNRIFLHKRLWGTELNDLVYYKSHKFSGTIHSVRRLLVSMNDLRSLSDILFWCLPCKCPIRCCWDLVRGTKNNCLLLRLYSYTANISHLLGCVLSLQTHLNFWQGHVPEKWIRLDVLWICSIDLKHFHQSVKRLKEAPKMVKFRAPPPWYI